MKRGTLLKKSNLEKHGLKGTASNPDFKDDFSLSKRSTSRSVLHDHSFFEIEIYLSDNGYTNINGQNFPIKKGMIVFNRPMDFHSITAFDGEKVVLINLSLNQNSITQYDIWSVLSSNAPKVAFLSEDELNEIDLLYEVFHNENSKFGYNKVTKLCFKTIMEIIMRNFSAEDSSADNTLFVSIINYLPKYSTNAFVYFDPPYYNNGEKLYKDFLEQEDHRNIAEQIFSHVKAQWIVSYDNVPQIRDIYNGYLSKTFSLSYSLANKGYGTEIMFFKDPSLCPSRQELLDANIHFTTWE